MHAVLSLWVTDDPAVLEGVTTTLRAAFAGRVEELSSHDAAGLEGESGPFRISRQHHAAHRLGSTAQEVPRFPMPNPW